jgi:hypothetical protein
MMTTARRHAALSVWEYLFRMKDRVGYPPGDVRTQTIHSVGTMRELTTLVDSPDGLVVDCSQLVELVCHVGGWLSPSGSYAYDNATASMLAGPCRKFTNPRQAGLMGIVVFLNYEGDKGGHHTAFVVEPDPLHGNPTLGSHGQQSDPREIRLRDEQVSQGGRPYVFLSVLNL